MKSKIAGTLIITCLIAAAVFAGGARANDIVDDSKDLFREIQLFADSITLISSDYVEQIKIKDLVYGAIRGMMNTLDGYSQFMDPESFKEITEDTTGEFGGIGVEVGVRDGVITVIAPIEDTPAFHAGVHTDDKIVKVDGIVTREMGLDDAVKKMRGKPGTEVTITVARDNDENILDFTLKRAVIKARSIKDVKIIENDIGYVRILEFQQRTANDLKKKMKELRDKGAKKLILDLRNNPGGLFNAAVEVADQFLEKGTMIVYTEGRNPEDRMDFIAKEDSNLTDMKMAVLVNKGSASGAEIVAGAIKDNKRGVVVGVTTFGKGSVQTVIPLSDKSALRLTTAAYYTPSGESLMNKGMEPDIYVEDKTDMKKPKTKKKDAQLEAAIRALEGQAGE